MKILLLDDDRKLAGLVRKGLESQGFTIDYCSHGDDAFALAITHAYDAAVLDIMVPGREGLSILRNLRDLKLPLPVVLITARSALTERIEGLNLGADDYITKPFYIEELVARLHAVCRRATGTPLTILQVGDLTANLVTRETRHRGQSINLTSREFALLTYLLRSQGQIFSRVQICEHVWSYHFDPGTNLIDVYVQRVRRKLEAAGATGVIETIRGVGYRVRPAYSARHLGAT